MPRRGIGRRGTIALAVVAVIATGAVSFALLGARGSTESPAAGEPRATIATSPIQDAGSPRAEKAGRSVTAEAPPPPLTHAIRLRSGEPVGGVAEIELERGERAVIVVRSDTETGLHLHGYDIEATAAPGKPARLAFTPDAEGVFEFETHPAGALVAQLSVTP